MPASFRIFPDHHLIFTRYYGKVVIDEYIDTVEGVIAHLDFNIHQKHLIDLTDLTKLKREYVKVLLVQARLTDLVARSRSDILNVVIAPTPVAKDAAKMALRSWDNLETKIIGRIVNTLPEAATLLGIEDDHLRALRDEIPIHSPT